jgi:hypothetical protein
MEYKDNGQPQEERDNSINGFPACESVPGAFPRLAWHPERRSNNNDYGNDVRKQRQVGEIYRGSHTDEVKSQRIADTCEEVGSGVFQAKQIGCKEYLQTQRY